LPLVKNLDAVARELERIDRPCVAGLHRGFDLRGRNAQAARGEIEAVEFARCVDQRGIAARSHVLDDGTGRALDISRRLALRRDKPFESLGEIGAASVEADGHGGFPAGARSFVRRPTAQWRGDKSPSTLELRHYGMVRRIRPGISGFRVRCFLHIAPE
jgi:hypothetical protein